MQVALADGRLEHTTDGGVGPATELRDPVIDHLPKLLERNSWALTHSQRLSRLARSLADDPRAAALVRVRERAAVRGALLDHASGVRHLLNDMNAISSSISPTQAIDNFIDLLAEWPTKAYDRAWLPIALRRTLGGGSWEHFDVSLTGQERSLIDQSAPIFHCALRALADITQRRLAEAEIRLDGNMWVRRGGRWPGPPEVALQLLDTGWAWPSPFSSDAPPWITGIPFRVSTYSRQAVPVLIDSMPLASMSVMPEGRPLRSHLGDPVSYFSRVSRVADGRPMVVHLLVPVREIVAAPGGLMAHALEEEVVVGRSQLKLAGWAAEPRGYES